MMQPRPTCAECGASYGRRGLEIEVVYTPYNHKPETPKVDPSLTLMRQNSHKWGIEMRHLFYFWDQKTYIDTKHAPFCSLKCALQYARRAHAEKRSNVA